MRIKSAHARFVFQLVMSPKRTSESGEKPHAFRNGDHNQTGSPRVSVGTEHGLERAQKKKAVSF